MLEARQERLTLNVAALLRLLAILFDPDRTLAIIPVRLGTSTRVYSALWDSGSQGDFIHPRVVKEAHLPTTGSPTPISVTLGDDKTQRFFDQTVTDLFFFLTLEPTDRSPASRRHRSSAHFDVMETGYDFILGTPWSRRFHNTEADRATNTLVLKTKCGQTYRVPFIGTTAIPRPDPPPLEPSMPTPSPSITVTSPRQFAHFIRQDDVTFFMVDVTDLLHYHPPCPDAKLIPLKPDSPSISMAPISTSVPLPSVESTPPSGADADAEELARYTDDLEPTVYDLIREYHDVFPSSFSYAGIPPMRDVEHSIQLVPDYRSISMDFIGPLRPPTPRGHDAILVVVDRFTKRARFVPCRYVISAREVADIVFDRVVRDHGLPLSIIFDRDPRFTSRFWRRLHKVYGTQLRFSSSYHPQTDGQTEITNRTLGDILRKIVRDDQQWDLHFAHAEIAYNHAVSPATGMSPYYCDLGYHPRVLADFLRPSQMHPDTNCPALDDWVAHMTSIMKTTQEHICASQTRMAARTNRSRMDHPFKVGDDVLIDAHHLQLEADTLRKFRRRFFDPCRILQAVGSDTGSSPVSFRVKLPDYLRQARVHDVYHVSLLRPYRKPSERFAGRPYERPPPIMVDGHEEFLVSDIIGRRVTDDNPPHVEYLVCWKGYPDEEATWEPLEHLQHARMLVRAYDHARRAGFTAPPQPTDLPPSPPAEEIAEVEPTPSEADLQQQPDASERPQRTRRRPARYDD
ncbi:hypothetical protein CBR_g30764 [Chara braunii]|uniref:Chromo domain-containing protein n=1 Tax=Chara braunii TaxID=69332 RepID=A0A388JX94_CHABU|nr:hypothetical protein CBR_g30764 [Chara braunii]|eukprot:GBG62444.1 hypothetical protein CBR_g30764 [Chara braunii]